MSQSDEERLAEQTQAAEAFLRRFPEWDWITKSGQQFWTAPEIARFMGVDPRTIKDWKFPTSFDFGGKLDMLIPRSMVLIYLYSRAKGDTGRVSN